MMFIIQAKVTRTIFGISQPYSEMVGKIVHANSAAEAQQKFENYCRSRYVSQSPTSVTFEYQSVMDELR